MTVDELIAREGIRHTLASYNIAGDRLRADDFAAVFTEDAVFESQNKQREVTYRNVGREQIRAWLTGWGRGSRDEQPVHKATFVRHQITTCRIDLTGPDTAEARTYWTAYTDIGPDHVGYYLDSFRKVGDQWLIAHRRVREDWMAPNSLFSASNSSVGEVVKGKR